MKISDLLDAGYKLNSKIELQKPGLFLWGKFMHGDADAYSQESTLIPSIEILTSLYKFLTTIWNEKDFRMDKHGRKELEDYFYSVVGEDWRKEYLYDRFLDWWPHDITCDGYRASLETFWVIFIDEQGQEYKVEKI